MFMTTAYKPNKTAYIRHPQNIIYFPRKKCQITVVSLNPARCCLTHCKGCEETDPPVLFLGVSAGLIDSPSPSVSD